MAGKMISTRRGCFGRQRKKAFSDIALLMRLSIPRSWPFVRSTLIKSSSFRSEKSSVPSIGKPTKVSYRKFLFRFSEFNSLKVILQAWAQSSSSFAGFFSTIKLATAFSCWRSSKSFSGSYLIVTGTSRNYGRSNNLPNCLVSLSSCNSFEAKTNSNYGSSEPYNPFPFYTNKTCSKSSCQSSDGLSLRKLMLIRSQNIFMSLTCYLVVTRSKRMTPVRLPITPSLCVLLWIKYWSYLLKVIICRSWYSGKKSKHMALTLTGHFLRGSMKI